MIEPLKPQYTDSGLFVSRARPWRTLWNFSWRTFSIACTIITTFIAVQADDTDVDKWSFAWWKQSAAILAVTSIAANKIMSFGLAQAGVTMFWLLVMKPGSISITDLHHFTQRALGFTGAMKSLDSGTSTHVSIVCLLVTLSSVMRAPLMQNVLAVRTDEMSVEGVTDLLIRPNVTDYWGGTMTIRGNTSVARFSDGFVQAVQGFQAKRLIEIPNTEPCENCNVTVQALGFNVRNCTERRNHYSIPDYDEFDHFNGNIKYENTILFEIAISSRVFLHNKEGPLLRNGSDSQEIPSQDGEYSALNVTTVQKESEACEGHTVGSPNSKVTREGGQVPSRE